MGRPNSPWSASRGTKPPGLHAAISETETDIPAFYQVHLGERDFDDVMTGVRVLPFTTFCVELNMP